MTVKSLDDYEKEIDFWHDKYKGGLYFHEYLGLTWKQYKSLIDEKLGSPMLPEIYIEARDWQDNSGRIQCFVNGTKCELAYLNWMVRGDNGRSVEILDLLVHDSSHRKNGIGSLLIQKLNEVMLEKGVFEVWGSTQFDDYPVHDFYRKHGFIFETKVKGGCVQFHMELQHKK